MITPSRFINDPKGHVFNQVGHGVSGWAAAAAISTLGFGQIASVVAVVAAYMLLIEFKQFFRAEPWVFWDSLEDGLHFGFGAIVSAYSLYWALPVWFSILGYGAWLRR